MGNILKECTILVIEPDKDILELLTLVLEEEQVTVLGFLTFSSLVIESIKHSKIDMGIVSFRGMGIEAIDILNQLRKIAFFPTLAFSCDGDIANKYKLGGFDGYINKPFDIDYLIIQLKHLLSSIR